MKKKIIIISVIVLLIVAGILCWLFFIKKDPQKDVTYVTITFDADGGSEVEALKIEEGKTINLPLSTKEGYLLEGWYKEEEKVSNETTYSEDTTLKAKWLEEKNSFVISFDSKGGTDVASITLECNKELTLPTPPTREGYSFGHWEDQNGTPILDQALLTCEDIKLSAVWEKKEENNTNTPKTFKVTFDSKGGNSVSPVTVECGKTLKMPANPTKSGYEFISWYDKNGVTIHDGALLNCENITLYADWKEVKKEVTYTCPEGYELDSTNKCVSSKSPEYYCPEGYTNSTKDNTVCYKYLKEPDVVACKDGKYHYTQTSYSGSKIHFCATELASYTGNLTGCQGAGGQLLSNSHCVKNVEQVGSSKLNFTCYSSVYRDGSSLASNEKDGCYDLKQREYGCKKAGEGYSMNYTTGKCVKTIDATKN